MRLGRSLLAAVLALSALPAGSETSSAGTPLRQIALDRLPPGTPLREIALDRLPPGARAPAERTGVEIVSATYGERVVERVGHGPAHAPHAADAATGDWLEVEYTVDPRLEERVRDVLERDGVALGHVVVMDPRSGQLFAYVSTDPERFPPTRAYPTASLMKILTAAAVLRNAPDAAGRMCRSVGSPYQLVAAHLGGGGHADAEGLLAGVPPGVQWIGSFRNALAISNNQCFARFAVHDVGEERLLAEMRRAGFLEAPAPRHPPGSVEPIEDALDLGNLGSGLAGSAISPLGAARLAGLLATGDLVTPRWIAQLRDPQGIAIGAPEVSEARHAWDPAIAAELRGLLEGVVQVGTASRAFHTEDGAPRLGPVRVAGKTGTLRGDDPAGLYQWFVGVAPVEDPRIAIAAVVVHPGPERGVSASEVAAGTLEQVFCAAAQPCDALGVEVLYARAAGRAAQIARGLREALASARPAPLELDEPLRPLGDTTLRLPKELLRETVRGEVALRVELDPRGSVQGIAVEASDLPPEFGRFLVEEVRRWRFTPPRRQGRPVMATVRLPIPIRVD